MGTLVLLFSVAALILLSIGFLAVIMRKPIEQINQLLEILIKQNN